MFGIGDGVFVRNPEIFVPGCVSMCGTVVGAEGSRIRVRGDIALSCSVGALPTFDLEFAPADLGHRRGTLLSKLSGRPDHPGFKAFSAIADSWGHL